MNIIAACLALTLDCTFEAHLYKVIDWGTAQKDHELIKVIEYGSRPCDKTVLNRTKIKDDKAMKRWYVVCIITRN